VGSAAARPIVATAAVMAIPAATARAKASAEQEAKAATRAPGTKNAKAVTVSASRTVQARIAAMMAVAARAGVATVAPARAATASVRQDRETQAGFAPRRRPVLGYAVRQMRSAAAAFAAAVFFAIRANLVSRAMLTAIALKASAGALSAPRRSSVEAGALRPGFGLPPLEPPVELRKGCVGDVAEVWRERRCI
jgi:hypothetical protein